jgi:hypothetical protein
MILTIFDSVPVSVFLGSAHALDHSLLYCAALTHGLPRTEHTFSIGSLVRFHLGPELNSTTYEESTMRCGDTISHREVTYYFRRSIFLLFVFGFRISCHIGPFSGHLVALKVLPHSHRLHLGSRLQESAFFISFQIRGLKIISLRHTRDNQGTWFLPPPQLETHYPKAYFSRFLVKTGNHNLGKG